MENIVIDTSVSTKKKGKLRWRKKTKSDQKENDGTIPKQKKIQKLAAKKKRKEEARKLARSNQSLQESMDTN